MSSTAINDKPRRTTMSTAEMVQDYRLARLFAAVGKALKAYEHDDEFDLDAALTAMRDDLLGIAPEFLPPFADDRVGAITLSGARLAASTSPPPGRPTHCTVCAGARRVAGGA